MPSGSDDDGDDEGLPAPEPNAYKCDAELLPHLLAQQAIRAPLGGNAKAGVWFGG